MLKTQLVLAAEEADGTPVDATGACLSFDHVIIVTASPATDRVLWVEWRCPPLGAGVQLQGVLDELLFYGGPLGATLSADSVRLDVWAPTAQQVSSRG